MVGTGSPAATFVAPTSNAEKLDRVPNRLLSLTSLSDEDPPGSKPKYSFHILIRCAISGSERQTLSSEEIIQAIEDRFPYFAHTSRWKLQLHENLSYTPCFKPDGEPPADTERSLAGQTLEGTSTAPPPSPRRILYWKYDPEEDPLAGWHPGLDNNPFHDTEGVDQARGVAFPDGDQSGATTSDEEDSRNRQRNISTARVNFKDPEQGNKPISETNDSAGSNRNRPRKSRFSSSDSFKSKSKQVKQQTAELKKVNKSIQKGFFGAGGFDFKFGGAKGKSKESDKADDKDDRQTQPLPITTDFSPGSGSSSTALLLPQAELRPRKAPSSRPRARSSSFSGPSSRIPRHRSNARPNSTLNPLPSGSDVQPRPRPTKEQMRAIKKSKRAASGFSLGDDQDGSCIIT